MLGEPFDDDPRLHEPEDALGQQHCIGEVRAELAASCFSTKSEKEGAP